MVEERHQRKKRGGREEEEWNEWPQGVGEPLMFRHQTSRGKKVNTRETVRKRDKDRDSIVPTSLQVREWMSSMPILPFFPECSWKCGKLQSH